MLAKEAVHKIIFVAISEPPTCIVRGRMHNRKHFLVRPKRAKGQLHANYVYLHPYCSYVMGI